MRNDVAALLVLLFALTAQAEPSKTGFAEVQGGNLHYAVHGDLASGKTPLLVLHGSYLSGEAMRPIFEPFLATRPVIVVDQRGHGRSGDLPGPITYELLGDDAAAVLKALDVEQADVLGYSMGGTAALYFAARHPQRAGKQIILSGTSSRRGWLPEVQQAIAKTDATMFAGSPMEREYKRLSPNPDGFATLVEKLRVMDEADFALGDDAVRAIDDKTMIILGDADGVDLQHALKLFELRGGVDKQAATQGFLAQAPRARLAVLPAMSHVGVMGEGELIARLAVPFLDDVKPAVPPGFFE